MGLINNIKALIFNKKLKNSIPIHATKYSVIRKSDGIRFKTGDIVRVFHRDYNGKFVKKEYEIHFFIFSEKWCNVAVKESTTMTFPLGTIKHI